MTNEKLQKRIAEIKATKRALIASDEGTHSAPASIRVYEDISGKRSAVKSFAGDNGTTVKIDKLDEESEGTIRLFRGEIDRMAALRRELKTLEEKASK